jgi:hypothetical protein
MVYGYRAGTSRRALAAFCVAAALAAAPLAWYFMQHPDTLWGRISQVSVTNSAHPGVEVTLNTWRTARMFFTRGDRNWRQNVAYRAELYWPVAILFGVGIVAALRRRRTAFLLLWMVVAALPAIFSDDSVPHALRSILLLPPAMMLAALGGDCLYGLLAGRLPRTVLMVAGGGLALWLLYEPFHTYFDVWAARPEVAAAMESDAAAAAAKINGLPRSMPKVVAIQGGGAFLGSLPVEAADIQYLTGSYTPRQQAETNIHYLALGSGDACPAAAPGSAVFCLEFRKGL